MSDNSTACAFYALLTCESFNPFPNDKFWTLSNSKSLQTTISNVMKVAKSSLKWVEKTVGKGENARYEQFLLFPQCFQKTYTADT